MGLLKALAWARSVEGAVAIGVELDGWVQGGEGAIGLAAEGVGADREV